MGGPQAHTELRLGAPPEGPLHLVHVPIPAAVREEKKRPTSQPAPESKQETWGSKPGGTLNQRPDPFASRQHSHPVPQKTSGVGHFRAATRRCTFRFKPRNERRGNARWQKLEPSPWINETFPRLTPHSICWFGTKVDALSFQQLMEAVLTLILSPTPPLEAPNKVEPPPILSDKKG